MLTIMTRAQIAEASAPYAMIFDMARAGMLPDERISVPKRRWITITNPNRCVAYAAETIDHAIRTGHAESCSQVPALIDLIDAVYTRMNTEEASE